MSDLSNCRQAMTALILNMPARDALSTGTQPDSDEYKERMMARFNEQLLREIFTGLSRPATNY